MQEKYEKNYSEGMAITAEGELVSIGSCTDTHIVIPNFVTKIGSRAFMDNCELESVVIPDSVERIGWDAFANCKSLINITIGNGLKYIASSAFENCTSLQLIEIPNSIEVIEEDVFVGCKSLVYNKEVSEYGIAFYLGNSDNKYLYLDKVEREIQVLKINPSSEVAVKINERCKIIGARVGREGVNDSYLELTNIVIPNSVTSIGNGAFSNCYRLENITIGKNVKNIGAEAFSDCVNLRQIYYNAVNCDVHRKSFIAAGVESGGVDIFIGDDLDEIPYVFLDCFKGYNNYSFMNRFATAKKISLGKGIVEIKEGAFSGFKLKEMIIGENVKSIGDNAFLQSTIRNIVIPDSVESLGWQAFHRSLLVSVSIGRGVKKIGADCFDTVFLRVVNYRGTVEEWQKIIKEDQDILGPATKTINCIDGYIDV